LSQDRIVAVGLLTQTDLNLLGPTFTRAWPIEDASVFEELVAAIDKADSELQHSRNRRAAERVTR
jgi:hypothetical protein